MNVLLLERNEGNISQLKGLLSQLQLMYSINIIDCLSSRSQATTWFASHHNPDLIIANTHLEDTCIIELFDEVQLELTVPVIFITNHSDSVLQAFKYNVIDYILKPYQLLDLRNAFRKLAHLLELRKVTPIRSAPTLYKDRFLIRFGNRLLSQEVLEIAYFYADNKTVFIVNIQGQKSVVDYNLSTLEKMLNPKLFFRLNRKYIINISSIKEIRIQSSSQMRVMLSPMQNVSVSRARVNDFKVWAGA